MRKWRAENQGRIIKQRKNQTPQQVEMDENTARLDMRDYRVERKDEIKARQARQDARTPDEGKGKRNCPRYGCRTIERQSFSSQEETPSPSKIEREIPEGVETSDQDLHVRKSTRYLSRSEPVPAALIYYSSYIPDVHGIASDSGYILAAVSGPARSARDIAILCSYTWAFNAKQTSFGFLLTSSATSEYIHGKQWHYRAKN
ncbi:uncharacterized protein ASPGLDRAFT_85785 [Aspergillus glaucus CBS 516.65]|uniref:Uncharacterized protein n=1 Tax=Aspergillus glaucus CBS 516.65 TaxID=1160497 RepID=A0A1L9V6H8_ASPGL|nr:hypothetical protein ASPGLDRAFT_85785 [Aspergillus glaucus CBS 516.65]OJJ79516.1 hypothetical protein ASPGLDRAFT_85785 [Aspergillus glaucus CBS 516.65]